MKSAQLLSTLAFAATMGASLVQAVDAADKPAAAPAYRSPLQVAFSPDGRLLAASDPTAAAVVFFDVASGKAIREVPLQGEPAGIAFSADGKLTYVAECTAGTVAEIDGNPVMSSKFIEIHFRGKDAVCIGQQMGMGRVFE